jgi:hypothetical protein
MELFSVVGCELSFMATLVMAWSAFGRFNVG